MQEMNNDEMNNNDDETLTGDDIRNADDESDRIPETILSQNQLPPLPEPTLSPVQITEAPPLNSFASNDELVDSSEEEFVESKMKIKVRDLYKIPILQLILHLMVASY